MMTEQELGQDFLREIVNHVRAYDTYSIWSKKSDKDILSEFLKRAAKESKASELTGHCEIDPKAMLKIYSYFKAIGSILEKQTGIIISVIINLDDEGNGVIIVYAGRLILINKSIRDANGFGFKSIEDIELQGRKLIEKALVVLENYKEVAKL